MQQTTIRQRNKVAKDLDDTLQQIRQKPGFENFFRAKSKESLLSSAYEGPVVVLNATELCSDAILITREQITSISLPQLLRGKRILLDWLWKAAVQPVLCELGFYPKVVDPLPLIWWIGVGLMAQAPIHAAAIYKKGSLKMTTLAFSIAIYLHHQSIAIFSVQTNST